MNLHNSNHFIFFDIKIKHIIIYTKKYNKHIIIEYNEIKYIKAMEHIEKCFFHANEIF